MSEELSDIVDFMDLINFTLSERFLEVWRYKYSEKFIKSFQFRILDALQHQKPIKINSLFLTLQKNNKYSEDQVLNFFESIDIDIYRPLVTGRLKNGKPRSLS
jgi:hypothetical protein